MRPAPLAALLVALAAAGCSGGSSHPSTRASTRTSSYVDVTGSDLQGHAAKLVVSCGAVRVNGQLQPELIAAGTLNGHDFHLFVTQADAWIDGLYRSKRPPASVHVTHFVARNFQGSVADLVATMAISGPAGVATTAHVTAHLSCG